jgi:hypothetical protein
MTRASAMTVQHPFLWGDLEKRRWRSFERRRMMFHQILTMEEID